MESWIRWDVQSIRKKMDMEEQVRLLSVFRGSVREILWSRQRKVYGFGSLDDLGEHHEVFQEAFHISCKAVGFHSNLCLCQPSESTGQMQFTLPFCKKGRNWVLASFDTVTVCLCLHQLPASSVVTYSQGKHPDYSLWMVNLCDLKRQSFVLPLGLRAYSGNMCVAMYFGMPRCMERVMVL